MILTKATDKEVKAETISRIKTLIDKYNLNPNVLKYFRKGQVYYSYLTAMGMMGSIDTISYNEDYEKVVKDFETENKVFSKVRAECNHYKSDRNRCTGERIRI